MDAIRVSPSINSDEDLSFRHSVSISQLLAVNSLKYHQSHDGSHIYTSVRTSVHVLKEQMGGRRKPSPRLHLREGESAKR